MSTVLEPATRRTVTRGWSANVLTPVVLAWITFVLAVDTHSTITTQRLLGVGTWAVLVVVLSRESGLVRAQTAVVIAFASTIEYTFSPLLVPAYVPPGHGLIYLAALGIGRSDFVRRNASMLMVAVVAVGGAWALYGVTLAARPDALGAFWFLCLVGFLLWGPSRGLYIGAFLVVSYLELLGTSVGTWAWQQHDPTGLVTIGNPPSGAAGGYGWFDLAALTAAPAILAGWTALSGRLRRPALLPSGDAER